MKFSICFIALLLLAWACKKDQYNPSETTDIGKPYVLSAAPEARSSYNHSNYGIYKGVCINAIDSQATFKINLANDGKSVYALQFMNAALRDSLIPFVVDSVGGYIKHPTEKDTSIKPGIPYYTIFSSFNPFSNGSTFMQFGVGGDGSSPFMVTTLLWNQTLNAVLKEKSGRQVFCYEGTYLGNNINPDIYELDSGRVALTLTADTAILIIADIVGGQFFPASGAPVVNNQFTIEVFDTPGIRNFVLTGNISGNTCSGTWVRKNSTAHGIFSTHRTL